MFPKEISFLSNRLERRKDGFFLVAFDEVGRGCLAGPVVAGASLWWVSADEQASSQKAYWYSSVRDSKKLSALKRTRIASLLKEDFSLFDRQLVDDSWMRSPSELPSLKVPVNVRKELNLLNFSNSVQPFHRCLGMGLGAASAQEIDELNIWNAVQQAMARGLKALLMDLGLVLEPHNTLFLMDGTLSIKVAPEHTQISQYCFAEADADFVSAGLSSVAAKYARDTFMSGLEQDANPSYLFAQHKGYGTKQHLSQLQSFGPGPWHRKTFLKKVLCSE